MDWTPISLGALPTEDAYNAFHAVLEAVAEAEDTVPRPVPMEEFYAWLESAPENRQTLFIVAAGVHCALHDDVTPWVEYRGREVMVGLAEREASRLRGMAQGQGWQDESLCRLVALAAVAGKLEGTQIERLAAESSLDLGFPTATGLLDKLNTLGLLAEGVSLPAPAPDILAASFLTQVFRRRPDKAGEWLWAGIEDDSNDGLSRIGRLAYDSEIILGIHDARPSRWLAEAVSAHQERCEAVLGQLTLGARLRGLLPAAIAAGRKLLEDETLADEERAGILNNLSLDLANSGDHKGALEAIQKAVEIRRRLADENPSRFEPDLATSLNNLSTCLAASGEKKSALKVSKEAVGIYRSLAEENPASFKPELAMSLGTLGTILRSSGRADEAKDAFLEAITVIELQANQFPEGPAADILKNLRRDIENTSEDG